MMPCQEVRRLTERFVALELSGNDEEAVRTHLQQCPACRTHVVEVEPALPYESCTRMVSPVCRSAHEPEQVGGADCTIDC